MSDIQTNIKNLTNRKKDSFSSKDKEIVKIINKNIKTAKTAIDLERSKYSKAKVVKDEKFNTALKKNITWEVEVFSKLASHIGREHENRSYFVKKDFEIDKSSNLSNILNEVIKKGISRCKVKTQIKTKNFKCYLIRITYIDKAKPNEKKEIYNKSGIDFKNVKLDWEGLIDDKIQIAETENDEKIKKAASNSITTTSEKLNLELIISNEEINKINSKYISLAYDKKTGTRYLASSKRSKDHADSNALLKCKFGVQSSKNKCEIVDRVEGKEKRVIKDNTQIAKKEEIVTPKKKLEVAKVEQPKQEDFKPKNKDNEAPIIDIAEAITVNDSNYKFEGKVSDQSKNIFVEVDGQLVDVKNGVFKVVGYSPVDKNIKIEAIDGFGNRSKPKIVKLTIDIKETEVVQKLEPLNPSNLNTKVSNNKVALIFGIENYSDSPKAQFANLDAKYFYDYARKAFGINKQNIKILVDQDATFIETNKVITKWLRSKIVEGESELIIFFAGHGLASPNGKELFLLSHDSDPDLLDITALSRSKLFKSIMSFNPSSVTMFLDTCYSGVSRDEEMLLASARPIRVVADEQDGTPDNFSIFSASKLDQISSGLSQAKHGIFSYFLMKGLEGKADLNNDKQITNGELLAYMDKNVSKKAAEQGRDQNPSFTGDPDKVLISFR